uniref:Uncharacterized protein n=1 Tax=Ciona intestinalis TaxID=7719 RepID=H2Y3M7_CIOIN
YNFFRAGICEAHYLKEHVIRTSTRSKLKVGARPCLNLPKQSSFSQPCRKEPCLRKALPQKLRHKNISDLQKSINNLNAEGL